MRLMSLVPPKLAAQFRNTELMKMCFLHMSYLFCCGTGDNNNALLFFQLSCVQLGHNETACAAHTLSEAEKAEVSAQASTVLKYWTFGQCFVAMFTVPFWSRLSDRYGRKFGLCLPPFALMLNYLAAAAFAETSFVVPVLSGGWSADPNDNIVLQGPQILTIIALIGGLIGPNYLYWAAAFCVNGDVTSGEDRMYSFPLQQGASYIGSALSPLVTGAAVHAVWRSDLYLPPMRPRANP